MSNKKEDKMDLAGDFGTAIFDLFAIVMEKLFQGLSTLLLWLFNKYVLRKESAHVRVIEKKHLEKRKTTLEDEAIGYSITRKKKLLGKDIDKRKHTLICGASGFGKTVLLDALIYDDLMNDKPVIFIDPKGDNQSMIQFINLCRINQRDFQIFSEYYEGPGQISLNPVKDGSFTNIADRIHYSFDWSDEHYETLCYTALKKACELVIQEKKTPSYQSILDKIIEISNPSAKKKLFARKDLEGIIMRLNNLVQSDFGQHLDANGLSMDEIWKSKKCIYIGVPVLGYPKIARALGRIILNDLSFAVYNSYKNLTFDNDGGVTPVGVYIDELSTVVSDQFIELLNKCRGAKMELTFAFQSPSDITKINPHLCQQIMENSSNWFVLKQRMEAGANMFSEAIGTTEGTKETMRIEDGKKLEMGSQRKVQELLAHHNIIKNLNQGQAIFLRHSPTRVDLINIKYIDPVICQNNIKILEKRGLLPKYFEESKKEKQCHREVKDIKTIEKEKLTLGDKKILNEVGRWKVIFIKDLYNSLITKQHWNYFLKRVRVLESYNLLQGTKEGKNGKYVRLTEKAILLMSSQKFELAENITHDLICTRVIIDLVNTGVFVSGHVPKSGEYEIDPDGILLAQNKEAYKVALEIELVQKSKIRITEKFKKYGKKDDIKKVIYVFNSKSVFNAYKTVLSEQGKKIREKIILSLDEDISGTQSNPSKPYFSSKTFSEPSPKAY